MIDLSNMGPDARCALRRIYRITRNDAADRGFARSFVGDLIDACDRGNESALRVLGYFAQ